MNWERWEVLVQKYLNPKTRVLMSVEEWTELMDMALVKLNYCLISIESIHKMLQGMKVSYESRQNI